MELFSGVMTDKHVPAAVNTRCHNKELVETVFPTGSAPRLYIARASSHLLYILLDTYVGEEENAIEGRQLSERQSVFTTFSLQ
jgi:hypothetical protein